MSRRQKKEDEENIKKIEEHKLSHEYSGPTVMNVKKVGTRITRKGTRTQRNKQYFDDPIFEPYRDRIIEYLANTEILLLLRPHNDWIAEVVAQSLVEEYIDESDEIKEDVEDDMIDFIEELIKYIPIERSGDRPSFSNKVAKYFLNYYNGDASENEISLSIRKVLKNNPQKIDLSDEEMMLEIVGFLAEQIRSAGFNGDTLEIFLEVIKDIYQKYGREGFPWKLDSIKEIANSYFQKSDFSKIEKRGVKEDYPCKVNNCGGMESVIYVTQSRSIDEGQTIRRFCTKCGSKR